MAYNNNREWDSGKDHWGGGPSRVRGREDDYYAGNDYNGDEKRRKFNPGVSNHLMQLEYCGLYVC